MLPSKKAVALAAGVVAALSVASFAAQDAPSEKGRQIVVGGAIDWVEKSELSALKEGVIKHIEFKVGRTVKEGEEIGELHSELARLTVAKAKLAAQNTGDIAKAQAQRKLAIAQNARIKRLEEKSKGYVSVDEKEKAEAELAVADALLQSANEAQKIAKADHDLAEQALKEHRIVAPFSGTIIEQKKYPGEAVRANEPVVVLAKTDKFRFVGYVPLETATRIKGNEAVEVRPMIEGSDLPIEQMRFKGRMTAVSRETQTVRTTEVLVLAEIDNPEIPDHPEHELRQGMRAEMTIILGPPAAKVAANKPR